MPASHEITNLLIAWSDGNREALDELVPLVKAELHRLARGYLAKERPGHLLGSTALINETYLRLIDWQNVSWQNRAHFFGVAARMMRNILVDYALRQKSEKQGGKVKLVSLGEADKVLTDRNPDLVTLDEALDKLERLNRRQCQVVELHFFGGLALKEIAVVIGVSLGTIKRDMTLAKLWLLSELSGRQENDT